MLIAVFWALGAVLAVVLAMLVMPWLGWRWLLGLSTLPFLLYLAFCYWLPESAHYDLLAGNLDAAMATLARLAADNGKPPPTETLTAGPQVRGLLSASNRILAEPSCSLECTYLTQADYMGLFWTTLAEGHFGALELTTVGAAAAAGLFLTLLVVDRLGRKKSMALCFVFPTEVRALGMGTCSTMAKLGALLTPFVSQVQGGYL
ncbi:hypothetical protein CRUP_010667 [Coryphaenoides rupestris]|nr:hypothetical protein CRUP_010667 [Coryphaenoides rupestris]